MKTQAKALYVVPIVASLFAWQITPAAAEDSIVLACYPGAPENFFRSEVIPRFEKKYNINVTYLTGNSAATIAKLQAQKDDPQIDVACIDDGPMVQAFGMGLLQPLVPSEFSNADQIQDVSKLPNEMGFGWGLFRLGIAFNPEEFKKHDIPTPDSWKDLAEPALKGHVIVSSISISYTQILLTLLAKTYGSGPQDIDAGFKGMRDIRKNVFTFDTTADLTSFFQQGEAWAAVWTDSETYSYVARTGYALKFAFPKEGTAAIQSGIAVIKGSKHTAAAKDFVNYLIGAEAQELMAKKLGWLPVNKKAALPGAMSSIIASPAKAGSNIVPIDWHYLATEKPAWTERWNKEVEVE